MENAIKLFRDCIKYMSWADDKLESNIGTVQDFVHAIESAHNVYKAPREPTLFDVDAMHTPLQNLLIKLRQLTEKSRTERALLAIESNYHMLEILRTISTHLFIAAQEARCSINCLIDAHNKGIERFRDCIRLEMKYTTTFDPTRTNQLIEESSRLFCEKLENSNNGEMDVPQSNTETNDE